MPASPICLLTRNALPVSHRVMLVPMVPSGPDTVNTGPTAWWTPLSCFLQARVLGDGGFQLENNDDNRAILFDLFWRMQHCPDSPVATDLRTFTADWTPRLNRLLQQVPAPTFDEDLWPELRACWEHLVPPVRPRKPGAVSVAVISDQAFIALAKLRASHGPGGQPARKLQSHFEHALAQALTRVAGMPPDAFQAEQLFRVRFWHELATVAPWAPGPRTAEQCRLVKAYRRGELAKTDLFDQVLVWLSNSYAFDALRLLNLHLQPVTYGTADQEVVLRYQDVLAAVTQATPALAEAA